MIFKNMYDQVAYVTTAFPRSLRSQGVPFRRFGSFGVFYRNQKLQSRDDLLEVNLFCTITSKAEVSVG